MFWHPTAKYYIFMKSTLLFIICILYSFAAYTQHATIKGLITRSADSTIVDNAIIDVLQSEKLLYSSHSSSDGKYLLNLTPGNYTLRFYHAVYKDSSTSIVLAVNTGDIITQNISIITPVNFIVHTENVVKNKSTGEEIKEVIKTTSTKNNISRAYKDSDIKKESDKPNKIKIIHKRPLVIEEKPVIEPIAYDLVPDTKIVDDLAPVSMAIDPVDKLAAYPINYSNAGLLTCGEINDFAKWSLWNDKSQEELTAYRSMWQLFPNMRYSVLVRNDQGNPMLNCIVQLISDENIVWQAVTDNTGKAELWVNYFTITKSTKTENLSIKIYKNDNTKKMNAIVPINEGINTFTVNWACDDMRILDLAFVVDATGSMGDEINYLKSDLIDVINNVKNTLKNTKINYASIFYKDISDGANYITTCDQTDKFNRVLDFIQAQYASGGGDFPEAVEDGLDKAIHNTQWSQKATAKILFLILDAPPHNAMHNITKLHQCIRSAAAMGIRIVPIGCSGIDKSTEYLMRSIALATNGTYIYLSDKSGIGGGHISPTTDVIQDDSKLNTILQNVIINFAYTPGCNDEQLAQEIKDIKNDTGVVYMSDTITDSNLLNQLYYTEPLIDWKYYPNPNQGTLYIESSIAIENLYLTDISGKLLQIISPINKTITSLDMTTYPNGIYYLKYEYQEGKYLSGKVILMR